MEGVYKELKNIRCNSARRTTTGAHGRWACRPWGRGTMNLEIGGLCMYGSPTTTADGREHQPASPPTKPSLEGALGAC